MKNVPMPPNIAALPKDKRGYPIPYVVFRDTDGQPHFTINDSVKQTRCYTRNLCHICGQTFGTYKAFIGGPSAAFHRQGAYIDGPAHLTCATYAAAVCPYLALTRYVNRIEGKTLSPDKYPENYIGFLDLTVDPERPDCFVIGTAKNFTLHESGNGQTMIHVPERPWLEIQVWVQGSRVEDTDTIISALRASATKFGADLTHLPADWRAKLL